MDTNGKSGGLTPEQQRLLALAVAWEATRMFQAFGEVHAGYDAKNQEIHLIPWPGATQHSITFSLN